MYTCRVTDNFLVKSGMQAKREDSPQSVATVPFAVLVLLCACFLTIYNWCSSNCDHGLDFRETSLYYAISYVAPLSSSVLMYGVDFGLKECESLAVLSRTQCSAAGADTVEVHL